MPRQKLAQEDLESRGLQCPKCGCRHLYVCYSRPASDGKYRRRRECRNCLYRFMTVEQVQYKNNGRMEDEPPL